MEYICFCIKNTPMSHEKETTLNSPVLRKVSIYEASQLEDKVRVIITQDLRSQARKDKI